MSYDLTADEWRSRVTQKITRLQKWSTDCLTLSAFVLAGLADRYGEKTVWKLKY